MSIRSNSSDLKRVPQTVIRCCRACKKTASRPLEVVAGGPRPQYFVQCACGNRQRVNFMRGEL